MKKILLSISCLASCLAFGQVQMNASVEKTYSGGSIISVDSTAYEYQFVGQGTMSTNKLIFDANLDIIPFWYQNDLIVPFAQSKVFSGSNSGSLTLSSRQSQITNAQTKPTEQVTTAPNYTPYYKNVYTYNSAGLRTSDISLFYNGAAYDTTEKITLEYNAQNLQIVSNYYDYNGGFELMSTDSSYYNGSDNFLTKKGYYRNGSGGQMIYDYRSEALYNGSTLQHVEVYFDTTGTGSAAPAKTFRAAYTFTSGMASKIDVLAYQGGILIPQPVVSLIYGYTGNNLTRTSQVDPNGDTSNIEVYEYYNPNLLSKISYLTKNGTTIEKDYDEIYYYGPLTADVKEITNLTVSVFPNPTSDFVTVQTEEKLNLVQIFNINGQLMSSEKPVNNSINVTHLSQGTYKMIVLTNKGQMNASFIKK
jgi:hypothetical protein